MLNKKKDKKRKTINKDIHKEKGWNRRKKDEKKEKLQKRRKGGERQKVDKNSLVFFMPQRYLKTNKQTNAHTLLFIFTRSTQIIT